MARLLAATVLVALLSASAVVCWPVSLWPQPQSATSGSTTLALNPSSFAFQSNSQSEVITTTFDRYKMIIFNHGNADHNPQLTLLPGIEVTVVDPDETLQFGFNESYTLTVPSNGMAAVLVAQTVYAAVRGMETFAQMVQFNPNDHAYELPQAPWAIGDFPRFGHRGLLMDTSRHFEPLETIHRVIDSMTYAKLNTLHWHVVDHQSFPFESMTYPLLWEGAYSDEEKFTQDDIRGVVEYARRRGVRVMIEFDIPGHAASWCAGYPDVCPSPSCNNPLDPSSALTFELLAGLLGEVTGGAQGKGLFPENFVHLGGDEVDTTCWTNTPHVVAWLNAHNMTTDQAYMYFVEQGHQDVIAGGRSPVNWEEVFNHFGSALDKQTIVHIWLDHATLAKVVAAGYRGILSNQDVWYLDHLDVTWQQFYLNDPMQGITDPAQQALVLGGEVCMWGETVDSSDIFATIWPRAGAAAERLWSAGSVNDTNAAQPRLAEFRCMLNRRGIAAAPTFNADARDAPPYPGGCLTQ